MADRDGDQLDQLIAHLYEAALSDDAHWQSIVQGLLSVLKARTGWLVVRPTNGGVSRILGSVGVGTDAVDAYRDHYWAKDPWLGAIQSLPTSAVFASHAYIDDTTFARTEIFADYVRPHFGNTTWCAAVSVPVAENTLATFSVHRLRSAGAFRPQEIRRLDLLVPHLRSALQLRHKVGSLVADRDRALDLLAIGRVAAIVLDEAGRVRFASPAAEEMLRRADGLQITAGGLRVATQTQQERIDRAIARAADAAVRDGTMLRVSRPSGATDWTVLIAPFTPTGRARGETGQVLCLIGDPDRDTTPSERHLMNAFGLTLAEARLGGALARGSRLNEIAARHGVTLATVRKQLSAVLAKTECQRQVDLLRLLLTLPQA